MKKRFALLLACILICTMFFACGKSYDGIAVEKAESQTGMAAEFFAFRKEQLHAQTDAEQRLSVTNFFQQTGDQSRIP